MGEKIEKISRGSCWLESEETKIEVRGRRAKRLTRIQKIDLEDY